MYHLDLSSCVSKDINFCLFDIIFVSYIQSSNKCFKVNHENMHLFIELPSMFDPYLPQLIDNITLPNNESTKEYFYILHSPAKFKTNEINQKTNKFSYTKNNHYCAYFLRAFFNSELKDNDPDPTGKMLNSEEIEFVIKNNNEFKDISFIPLHYKAFWDFLYVNFVQINSSELLKNYWYQHYGCCFKHWKHLMYVNFVSFESFLNFHFL